jgi:sirohydrochlorin ferrochelatase
MSVRGILLVDHGSRRDGANASLDEMAALVRAQLGEGEIVGVAHMELAAPSIGDGIRALIAAGATELVVVPYFLAAGRHSTEDIPRLVAEAMAEHPGVTHRVAAPLGVDALLAALVIKRASV